MMRLHRDGTCACGRPLSAGTRAGWDPVARVVVCEPCLAPVTPVTPDPSGPVAAATISPMWAAGHAETPALDEGSHVVPTAEPTQLANAGASLAREANRRADKREARVRERFPRVGGVLLALAGEPTSTTALRKGAEGERKAAERIIGRCGESVLFLLNRRLGAGRHDGDIDMLVISAAGVHIVDVKHFRGAKVEVRKKGGFLSERTESLWIGGRDRTALLASIRKQEEAVRSALAAGDLLAEIQVTSLLCFVDADLPLLGRLRIQGTEIRGSRELGRLLRRMTGPLDEQERWSIYERLRRALPPA